MISSLLSPRRGRSEQLQEQRGCAVPHTRIRAGSVAAQKERHESIMAPARVQLHQLLHQTPPVHSLLPSAPHHPGSCWDAVGMLQALLLTRVLPLVPPFPLEVVVVLLTSPHLRPYLIFARAGHSPCLNPAQARSVPANGS